MILNRSKPDGRTQDDNCFICTDDSGKQLLGKCTVYPVVNEALFPERPLRLHIELSHTEEENAYVQDALLGAAIARARHLSETNKMPARVFMQLDSVNDLLPPVLEIMGFADDDGLVRMRCPLRGVNEVELPSACVSVEDTLEDELEQQYFLDRYNGLFLEENDLGWLQALRACDNFKRILFVTKLGMAGEIVYRVRDDGCGELLWLFTASRWRHKGIATRLLQMACSDLYRKGIDCIETVIQTGIPNLIPALEKQGFVEVEQIYRYPGIDINPIPENDKQANR